jgi:hypothetical protein
MTTGNLKAKFNQYKTINEKDFRKIVDNFDSVKMPSRNDQALSPNPLSFSGEPNFSPSASPA